jgi:hypothetical protein
MTPRRRKQANACRSVSVEDLMPRMARIAYSEGGCMGRGQQRGLRRPVTRPRPTAASLGTGPLAGVTRSSLHVGPRMAQKQESRNQLTGWDQATSRQRRIGGNQVHRRDQVTRRHEDTGRDQVTRSEKLFQIGGHYRHPSRARCIARRSGFSSLIQSREGSRSQRCPLWLIRKRRRASRQHA